MPFIMRKAVVKVGGGGGGGGGLSPPPPPKIVGQHHIIYKRIHVDVLINYAVGVPQTDI